MSIFFRRFLHLLLILLTKKTSQQFFVIFPKNIFFQLLRFSTIFIYNFCKFLKPPLVFV